MGNLLECKALQEFILYEDLLYSCICGELQTLKILICALDFGVHLVGSAKLVDLVHFSARAIDQDQILRLCLEEKQLKRNTIHSGLER